MSEDIAGLVARAGNGDETVVSVLFAQYRRRLIRFALARGVRRDEADDLVQEVFCACLVQIRGGRFRGQSSLATWLMGILNHKLADWKESAWRRQQVVGIDAAAGTETKVTTAMDETAFSLRELIAAMPSLDRAIILMHETGGWTTDEIATFLHMKPGTVGRHLWRARQSLREQIRLLSTLSPLQMQHNP